MATKILLIDDEAEVLEIIKKKLRLNGYEVLAATDGYRGLDKAKDGKPDLILLDIMMPGLDGFAVLSQLKANPDTSSIPVIMLTAKGDTSAIMEAQKLHAVDYLIKPFVLDELLALIKRYLS